jgi:ABC-type uncharacterized transport system involved in gliding motility auxiliary subunit
MSTPTPPGDTTPVRAKRGWLLTSAGVALVAGIFLTVNWFFSLSSANLDFTEAKVHTLSAGTESILKRIDTDVTIKLYVSPEDDLMPQFRPVIGQVEGWLQRYHELKPDLIKVQKFVVERTSEEEQEAGTTGLQPQQGMWFGIAITCLEKTTLIPWVPALFSPFVDEDRIEFGLSSGLSEVTSARKKVLGLMSPLKLAGDAMPFGGGGQPTWAIYEMLKSQYEIKNIELTTTKIDPTVDVLLLLHPAGITDEAQWAVDQYLLGGGHVIAFLDTYNLVASQSGQQQRGMPPGMSPGAIPTGSNLAKLLTAWGYIFESDKIVADMGYATPMGPNNSNPLLLTLGTEGIDRSTDITKQLNDFWFIFSGTFTGTPASGLTEKILLKTSVKNQMVETSYASANPGSPSGQQQMARLNRSFRPEGKERILAFELTGKFKTAFPEGKPAPPPPAPPGQGGGMGGMGGLPPGMNFGPQGEAGEPGTAATAPIEVKAPEAAPAGSPAAAPAPAAPAPVAPAPATPSVVSPPVTIEPKPADAPAPPAANPAPALTPAPATPAPALTPAPTAPAVPAAAPSPLLPPPAGAAGATPPPVAPSGDPNAPVPLKESTKDGMVFLVGDTDMLADILAQQQILQNSNLPFAVNLVDQAAGDKDLMSIRSRGSARRPFSTIKLVRDEATSKIRDQLKSMDEEVEKINADIQSQKTNKDRNAALMSGWKKMEQKSRDIAAQKYQLEKKANKEVKSKLNFYQWMNIILVPAIIAGIGLLVLIIRKLKTSAR